MLEVSGSDEELDLWSPSLENGCLKLSKGFLMYSCIMHYFFETVATLFRVHESESTLSKILYHKVQFVANGSVYLK